MKMNECANDSPCLKRAVPDGLRPLRCGRDCEEECC